MKPTWLPEIISINGEWDTALDNLYTIFKTDFVQGQPTLNGIPIWWDNRKTDGKYEEGFWHLITKEDFSSKERLFDSRRAERLCWCVPTILNSKDNAVKIWDYEEAPRRVRTYVWLEQLDYLIILEKRKNRNVTVLFLVTAYYVEGESTKKKLEEKYSKRIT